MSGLILLLLRIALAIGLYTFLGWGLLTLWRDFKRQTSTLASRQPPPITLLHLIEEETLPYQFNIPEITIGRDPACDCTLNDQTVSAQHTRLSYHQGQWWVEDLRSTNGTFLNQENVAVPLVITDGDELRCGQVIFSILIGDRE
jgi:pSer/pThr/pTyr-binding forkhead associated (FHA) protein